MRVETSYRTVVIQLNPDREDERDLRKATESVFKFIGQSKFDLQKLLYAKFKDEPMPSARSVALMVQRFTGAVGEKHMLPVDASTSKFIHDKEWFLEASIRKKSKEGFTRVRIPVSKTEVPYYADIEDMLGFPTVIVRENDKWFAYVSIKEKLPHTEVNVGIDFNFSKWVAAPSEGQPLFFDATPYNKEVEDISRRIQRLQQAMRKSRDEEVSEQMDLQIKEQYGLRTAVVKRAHGNFLSAVEARFGKCNLVVERVSVLYRLTGKENRTTNNWLYKKTSLSQFQLRAMAHGFDVSEINPAYTSQACHRCGELGVVSGKNDRSFSCPACGLENYHRDLNAARNIAKVFEGTFPDIGELKEKKKEAKRVAKRKPIPRIQV